MKEFFEKTVLVTGHTGFKGSWLSCWLTTLGANVVGVSLDIPSSPSNFEISDLNRILDDRRVDVRDRDSVRKIVLECQPDFVIHLAAQAVVRKSYKDPLTTMTTNALGTANVLEPLSGYLSFAANLSRSNRFSGEAYNFGPPSSNDYPVSELIDDMAKYWGNVRWRDVSDKVEDWHEAGLLKLNCDKAMFDLHWRPTLNFDETVSMTVDWYKKYYQEDQHSMREFSLNQISNYTKLAKKRGIWWACRD